MLQLTDPDLEGQLDEFVDMAARGTAAANVAGSINEGRAYVFKTKLKDIKVFQYSAVLDRRTCPTCGQLDGAVVEAEEYGATPWHPPIHMNCRCIWVAIGTKQVEAPAVTGIPDVINGLTGPEL